MTEENEKDYGPELAAIMLGVICGNYVKHGVTKEEFLSLAADIYAQTEVVFQAEAERQGPKGTWWIIERIDPPGCHVALGQSSDGALTVVDFFDPGLILFKTKDEADGFLSNLQPNEEFERVFQAAEHTWVDPEEIRG